jgi:hypothetical protein
MREFSEFECSPKWPFSEMCRTRQTPQRLPTWFALTRQTCESQVLQVLHEFGKFGEFGKFSECRLDHFMHKNILFVLKTTYLFMRQHLLRLGKYSPDSLTLAKHFCKDSPD